MAHETRASVPVTLEDGVTIRIETPAVAGRQKVGVIEALPFQDLMGSIEAVAKSFNRCLEAVEPKKATIEFGVEATVEGGKLVALIAEGSATANFKITLEWGD